MVIEITDFWLGVILTLSVEVVVFIALALIGSRINKNKT